MDDGKRVNEGVFPNIVSVFVKRLTIDIRKSYLTSDDFYAKYLPFVGIFCRLFNVFVLRPLTFFSVGL